MSKCYYCGSVGRGCPECNANSRVGGKTEALAKGVDNDAGPGADNIYNACPPATWSLEQIQAAVDRVEAKYGKIEAKAWGGRIAVSMEQLNDKLLEDYAIKMRTYWDNQIKQRIHHNLMMLLGRDSQ